MTDRWRRTLKNKSVEGRKTDGEEMENEDGGMRAGSHEELV